MRIVGPDGVERREVVVGEASPFGHRDAEGVVFVLGPSEAEADHEAALGQQVEGGELAARSTGRHHGRVTTEVPSLMRSVMAAAKTNVSSGSRQVANCEGRTPSGLPGVGALGRYRGEQPVEHP